MDEPQFWSKSGSDWAGPFLGGLQAPNSIEPSGGWHWISGEAWDYTNWRVREPNDWRGLENRLHYLALNIIEPTWNDTIADTPRLGYVVEWTAIPEPGGFVIGATALAAFLLWRRPKG